MAAAAAAAGVAALNERRVAMFFEQLPKVVDAGCGVVESDFDVGSTGRGVDALHTGNGAQQFKYAGDVGGVQGGSQLESVMHVRVLLGVDVGGSLGRDGAAVLEAA
jgi:hypothetical protein